MGHLNWPTQNLELDLCRNLQMLSENLLHHQNRKTKLFCYKKFQWQKCPHKTPPQESTNIRKQIWCDKLFLRLLSVASSEIYDVSLLPEIHMSYSSYSGLAGSFYLWSKKGSGYKYTHYLYITWFKSVLLQSIVFPILVHSRIPWNWISN